MSVSDDRSPTPSDLTDDDLDDDLDDLESDNDDHLEAGAATANGATSTNAPTTTTSSNGTTAARDGVELATIQLSSAGDSQSNLLKTKDLPSGSPTTDGIAHTDTGEGLSPRSATYTVDDAISHSKFGRFQYYMLVACGVAWATDALEVMLLTFLMPELRNIWDLGNGADGLLGSIVFFGMMLGAVMWGRLSDRYGRKFGYLGSVATSGTFGLLSSLSPNPETLIAFRFFVGLGLGGAFVSYSLFAEFVPKQVRGVALVAEQVLWTFGALFCVAIAAATLPTLGWRWFLAFCSLPLLVNCVVYFWIPESPRFLITQGRHDEAEAILRKVARINGSTMIEGRLADQVPRNDSTFLALLSPTLRRTTLCLWLIWFSVTFGYYGVSFITPRFFNESENLYLGVFITTVSEFPGLLLPALCIDRLGRKKTLGLSFAIIALSSFVITVPAAASNVDLDIFILFVARLFASGAFAVTYIYTSEVYPTVVRTTGLGMTSFFSRVAGMITTFVAEDLPTSPAMLIYGSLSVAAIAASLFLPIDTTGQDLKDHIDDIAEPNPTPQTRTITEKTTGASNGLVSLNPKRRSRYNELEEDDEEL